VCHFAPDDFAFHTPLPQKSQEQNLKFRNSEKHNSEVEKDSKIEISLKNFYYHEKTQKVVCAKVKKT
jgi:hypothetical protein